MTPNFQHVTYDVRLPALNAGVETSRHGVVIAGGGPVGLALALALAKHGLRSVVLEADTSVCVGSRAICLSRRTFEILDRLGALAPFLARGLPWTGGRSFFGDREVLKFEMGHDANQRFAPMTNIQQYLIEQFLVDEVLRHPGLIDLRWGTRVAALDNKADGVVLNLEAGGTRYRTRSEWVIACDGARSRIRQELGLKMRGTAYEGRYVIADIEIDLDWPTERLAWFDPPSNRGRTMLMHRQPDKVWRIDYQLHEDEDADEMIAPDKVEPVITRHLAMLGLSQPWRMLWTSSYKASALSLDSYRHGRVLFAGDAAHLVPIFGVRGLNSGFDDAFNLAWKLALVARGEAADSLLDSYTWERRGAWATNIAHAMKSTEFMAPPSRGFELMRDAVLSLAADHPGLRALINPRQSSVIDYHDSPLNTITASETTFAAGPHPGEVVPEHPVLLANGCRDSLTRLLPDRFTTLLFCDDATDLAWAVQLADAVATKRQMRQPAVSPREDVVGLDVKKRDGGGSTPDMLIVVPPMVGSPQVLACATLVIDEGQRLRQLFDGRARTLYLIRPDGHVCARWREPEAHDLADATCRAISVPDGRRAA